MTKISNPTPTHSPTETVSPIHTEVDVNDLLLFPEVMWDRFGEDFVFGWIARDDGKSDFCILHYGKKTAWVTTSSKKYSAEFTRRWSGREDTHDECHRVEWQFPDIKNKIVLHPKKKALTHKHRYAPTYTNPHFKVVEENGRIFERADKPLYILQCKCGKTKEVK